MKEPTKTEGARLISLPAPPDRVLSPKVVYELGPLSGIYYCTEDERNVRVTFENLDALQVCRGEYLPYPLAEGQTEWTGLYQIENSRWQRERHAYESRHYRGQYEWGGDVDDMLNHFGHYLFRFHDQFIECLCAGFWFEVSSQEIPENDLLPGHPRLDLPASTIVDEVKTRSGLVKILQNPKPADDILSDARFGSQALYQFDFKEESSDEDDGWEDWEDPLDTRMRIKERVEVRVRENEVTSIWRGYLAKERVRFEGLPSLEDVKAQLHKL